MSAPHSEQASGRSRGPGRPRQDDISDRVLDAVLALIDADTPVTVNAVVARSGVSRAALYRRWATLPKLVAAALDRGRSPIELPEGGSALETLERIAPQPGDDVLAGYSEARLRQRLRLGLADHAVQREYWESHVSRRRAPVTAELERGRRSGEIRADIDPEIVQDLLAGMYYYQVVVRGEQLQSPEVIARCRAATTLIREAIENRAPRPDRAPHRQR
ncbi:MULTISPECIES: TetR/AcrR family transcriptional regulator [Pseudonocardia]|uniref:HTH tetR-type domain-containing protein n=2 Tax=Pseudonocardia TaxID=1847 RepID=A0A1Y2MYC9_PSEAH|nr:MULTISPECIES: TetR-like C-terminal domain-containing protein [Pseudonocardia]OSY40193.1 hypothetical protein BG845_03016 [Pseudonocardia autotrophica]TDN72864.1 TetR family transcriptional regulator [Pseudonocardia autotrophica]BBG03582.1 hypothetical protein Pdca_47910 [Pseudonocardia autotrophica]GEC28961.1 hypothetical protein PSA01_59900 [Pseudonocardia saturnea]